MLFTPYGLMGFSKVNYNKHTYISLPWLLVISLRETRRVHTRVYIVRGNIVVRATKVFAEILAPHYYAVVSWSYRRLANFDFSVRIRPVLARYSTKGHVCTEEPDRTHRRLRHRTFFVGQRQTVNGKSGYRKKFWTSPCIRPMFRGFTEFLSVPSRYGIHKHDSMVKKLATPLRWCFVVKIVCWPVLNEIIVLFV